MKGNTACSYYKEIKGYFANVVTIDNKKAAF